MNETTESNPASTPYLLPLSIVLASLIISASILFVGSKRNGLNNTSGLVADSNTAPQQLTPRPPSNELGTRQLLPNSTVNLQTGSKDGHAIGPANSKVTVVEFTDFECPFCGRFHTDSGKQIRKDYVDAGKSVRYVIKHYPLPVHSQAAPAANASECAAEQGNDKFWAMHDKMFENQAILSDASYKRWAQQLGLGMAKFNLCYDGKKYNAIVAADSQAGQSAGVSATPTIFVIGPNGTLPIVGAKPYAQLKTAIDSAL
jgi:protein-disulfide isomerase